MSILRWGILAALLSLGSTASAMTVECETEEVCQQYWWRVMAWLEENSRFKPRLINENLIEARAKTPAHKNRLQYRVERSSAEGQWQISAEANCRSSTGCPSIEAKLTQLRDYLLQPLAKPDGADAATATAASGIDGYVQSQHCERHELHHLRSSWAGSLYELECQQQQRRESQVVRCRGQQCRQLR